MGGKKAKQGKARKDKFYFLSKQTGFRSRAAFKLIQINRKFNFLKSSRVLIDLCAAPGSWLQVAQQEMPVSSIIVGFDLVPIHPIPNVKTYQEDITSDKCRQIIKKELQSWKADCVLHDGAPNVGKSWLHDEYQQAELSLHSFRLATEFLRKGGVFVTKVFRSRDYEPLKWVLEHFFHNVKVMKPEASRLESAEIYLVCLRYKEPDHIDPKFLNPKYVFKDVIEDEKKIKHLAQIPVTGKRKAVGYEEHDWKYQKITATEFMENEEFLLLLSKANEISINSEEVLNHPSTTNEIKACCADIKACGRAELRSIVSWRKRLIKDLKKKPEQDEKEFEEEEKSESQLVDEEISRLHKEEKKEAKKKVRKIREEKKKLHERMQLQMHHPDDQIEQIDDVELFSLSRVKPGAVGANEIALDSLDPLMTAEEEEEKKKKSVKKQRHVTFTKEAELRETNAMEEEENAPLNDEASDEEMDFDFDGDSDEDEGDSDEEEDSGVEDEVPWANDTMQEEEEDEEENPLLVDWQSKEERRDGRVESWYDKDIFKDSDDDDDDMEAFSGEESDEAETPAAATTAPKRPDSAAKAEKRKNKKEEKRKRKVIKLSAEELALGEAMATSLRQRREMEEESYHKYMGFGDGSDNLPGWFVDDERRHMRKPLPVSHERVMEYRKREKAIDSRTIGKVAEAKARKRAKAQKRLEKVRKKADTITNEEGMPDTEKWGKIKQLYKKAGFLGQKKRSVKYVVSSRSGTKPSRGGSKGKKGQLNVTKVVDKRMKADKRGMNATKRKTGRPGRGKRK